MDQINVRFIFLIFFIYEIIFIEGLGLKLQGWAMFWLFLLPSLNTRTTERSQAGINCLVAAIASHHLPTSRRWVYSIRESLNEKYILSTCGILQSVMFMLNWVPQTDSLFIQYFVAIDDAILDQETVRDFTEWHSKPWTILVSFDFLHWTTAATHTARWLFVKTALLF